MYVPQSCFRDAVFSKLAHLPVATQTEKQFAMELQRDANGLMGSLGIARWGSIHRARLQIWTRSRWQRKLVRYLMRGINGEVLGLKYLNVGKILMILILCRVKCKLYLRTKTHQWRARLQKISLKKSIWTCRLQNDDHICNQALMCQSRPFRR